MLVELRPKSFCEAGAAATLNVEGRPLIGWCTDAL